MRNATIIAVADRNEQAARIAEANELLSAELAEYQAEQAAKTTGVRNYYPEMGDAKPEGDMFASLSHYGRHWFIYTDLELKGRGITHQTDSQGGRGYSLCYKVTERAFDILKAKYAIVTESLL